MIIKFMWIKFYKNYLILGFILIFICCQQEKDKNLTKGNVSITYPPSFELDTSGNSKAFFTLKKPRKDKNDRYVESMNLLGIEIENLDFDKYAEKEEKVISSIAKIIESKRLVINDKDCLRLVFELSQNNLDLTYIQHLYNHKNAVYALTFSCETQDFEQYLNETNKIFSSFIIN